MIELFKNKYRNKYMTLTKITATSTTKFNYIYHHIDNCPIFAKIKNWFFYYYIIRCKKKSTYFFLGLIDIR